MSKYSFETKCLQSIFLQYHGPKKIVLLLSSVVGDNTERLVTSCFNYLFIIARCSQMFHPVLCTYFDFSITKLSKLKATDLSFSLFPSQNLFLIDDEKIKI